MRVSFALQIALMLSVLPLRAVGPAMGRGTPPSALRPSPLPVTPGSWRGHSSGSGGIRSSFPGRFPPPSFTFGPSGCLLLPSPAELYPLFASQSCNFPAYPPETDIPQPSNVIVLPPPYVPLLAPQLGADSLDQSSVNNQAHSEAATFHFSQTPSPTPVVLNEYPALVVFRSGGVYSAAKYWVKNKRFYFVTIAGETLYTPAGQVDQIYPAIKPAQ